jgi:hypothetical protein
MEARARKEDIQGYLKK